jgi:hypothetical protein
MSGVLSFDKSIGRQPATQTAPAKIPERYFSGAHYHLKDLANIGVVGAERGWRAILCYHFINVAYMGSYV